MTTPDVLEAAKPWMRQCGPCDAGLPMACICPPGDPRAIVARLAAELIDARKALLDVTDVFGYYLTNDEVAELIREGWQGVPQRVEEDLGHLRDEYGTQLDVAYRLLRDLTDDESCEFDHHGGCQAHGYLSLEPGEKCPQQEAKELLKQEGGPAGGEAS